MYQLSRKKYILQKVLFKGELSNLNSNLQMIKDKNGIIPKMCYTGRNGRYLSFVNDDITVNALRSLILGDITKLIIEKHSSKYIIKLELLENYSKEEISIQSFLEQALSETQTYSNDSLFRENKEKSIDIAYFTNVIKKMAELINDKYRCDFQSSEILRYHYLFKIIIHIMLLLNLISIFIKKDFKSLETVVKSNYLDLMKSQNI